MSGTSHDGVDAALVSFEGAKPELLSHTHLPYSASLRSKISSSFDGATAGICALNFELGEIFARVALLCAGKSGVGISGIDAVASHGQTIYHIPPSKGKPGSTLQIGESAVIAQRTGLPVVSDFRPADMAAGGQGAPLVPFADHILFKGKKAAIQNIGGMANVTVVAKRIEEVFAFDTGPGNCLIDGAMGILFKKPFDKDGRAAREGSPDRRLLAGLLSHPYFSKMPPKSTGRETFNTGLFNDAVKKVRPHDLISTLTHFTAVSIKRAYERFILPESGIDEVILSGGGAKNIYLVGLLRELFEPIKVSVIDEYGIPSGAKEAMSFAILARETLMGRPSNLPRVTGAKRQVVLGKITRP